MKFRLVTEQAELFAIAPQWHELLQASAAPEAMLDPSWLLNWWRHYGAGVELAVGLLYDGETLVGLAPLCIRQYVYRFVLVFRRLQFLGVDANEKDGVFSEYMGFIARRGYEEAVASLFVQALSAGGFGAWHEIVLAMMNGDNPMAGHIEASLARVGLAGSRRASMSGYYIKLPRTWDAYLQSLTSSRRYRIKNSLSRFEEWAAEKGGWTLERATTPETLEEGYAALVELHEERWRVEGGDGAFSSPRFKAFHRDYISSMLQSGDVDLCWLKVGGQAVAAIYTIRNGKNVLAYQYGRAMGLPARVRVGIVINALMIKEAIARGDEEFDFLGGEARYKVEFASDARDLVQIRAARPTAREYVRLGMINARDRFVAAMKASEELRQPRSERVAGRHLGDSA